MKKIIILLSMFAFIANSFGQKSNPGPTLTKQDYLQKSKKQKTAAWIMAGGGASLIIISIVTTTTEDAVNFVFGEDKSGVNTGTTLFTIGGLATLGSIPLFIASGKNKRKAMNMSASLKMEKITVIQKQSFVTNSYPAVSLKFSF